MSYSRSLARAVLIASCLTCSATIAQDLSTAFIADPTIADNSENRGFVTMGPIEDVFAADGDIKDPQLLERQIVSIIDYLNPILANEGTLDALRRISPEAFEGERFNPESGAFALLPIVDALEGNTISSEVRALLTGDITGMALFSTTSAIRYAICLEIEKRIIESDGADIPDTLCERPGLGKIDQWSFNKETGEGFIRIRDMIVDRYRLGFDGGNVTYDLAEQSSYTWRVSIKDPGYDEALRISQEDYIDQIASSAVVDPFKTTVQRTPGPLKHPSLPADAKDVNNMEDSIWARGLDQRLTAYGSAIKIESITEKRYAMFPFDDSMLGDDASLPLYIDFTGSYYARGQTLSDTYSLDADHPYLQTSDESCIDIMFAGDFPRHFVEFPPSQPGWCLGRCNSPVIANSK